MGSLAWYLLGSLAGAVLGFLVGAISHRRSKGAGLGVGLVAGCVAVALVQGGAQYLASDSTRSPSSAGTPTNSPPSLTPSATQSKEIRGATQTTAPPSHSGSSATTDSANQSRQVFKVKLEPLCRTTSCAGTQLVGEHAFSYTDEAPANTSSPRPSQAFPNGINCTVLTVKFAGDSWSQGAPQKKVVSRLAFLQENSPAVYGEVGPGEIGTLRVALDGGPVIITAQASGDTGVHDSYILMDVTGDCATPDGLGP